MVNEKFVTVYRDCRADKLWEICYRCAGQLHKGDEKAYLETEITNVRADKEQRRLERRPFALTSQWHNYSYQTKYAETPACVSSSMRRYSKRAVQFLEKRAQARALNDAKEESEESKRARIVSLLVLHFLNSPHAKLLPVGILRLDAGHRPRVVEKVHILRDNA